MRVFYLCHPVSGDVPGNLARARRWLRWIMTTRPETVVIAPWIVECEIFDDSDPVQRAAGLEHCKAVIAKCDGVIVVGGVISKGMRIETDHARSLGIEIVDMSLFVEPPDTAPASE